MQYKIFLVIFIFIINTLSAQNKIVSQDSLANTLVEKHKRLNAAHPFMPGYRVQLYFGNDRTHATEMKSDFLLNHPKIGAYVIYHQPNFKLRVGDFKFRLEAVRFLQDIKADYNAAFIVQDDVKLPDE